MAEKAIGDDISEYGSREWVTGNGTKMKWSQMTASHLRNAAAFIRRKYWDELSAGYSAYSMVQGDAAEYSIECGLRSLEEQGEYVEAYAKEMELYAKGRK